MGSYSSWVWVLAGSGFVGLSPCSDCVYVCVDVMCFAERDDLIGSIVCLPFPPFFFAHIPFYFGLSLLVVVVSCAQNLSR